MSRGLNKVQIIGHLGKDPEMRYTPSGKPGTVGCPARSNRVWQKFFGRGLVEPLDDMEHPAWSPDVLDWLAEDFGDHGYNVKHLIEVMMTSRAYQLPATPATEQVSSDFVFRGPQVRRLSAEQYRDAVGALTGIWYEKPATQIRRADGSTNQFAVTRASVVAADTLQVALGRPNREQVLTSRASAATTLEALELTNGAELAELLKQSAEKILAADRAKSSDALVAGIYEQALGRKPNFSLPESFIWIARNRY